MNHLKSNISRRVLLIGSGTMLTGAAAYGAYSYNTTEELELTKIKIWSETLPESFHGYKIAFLSDIHFGEAMSEAFLQNCLKKVDEEQPDILALGGDYLWIPFSMRSKGFRVARNPQFTKLPYKHLPEAIINDLLVQIRKMVNPADGIISIIGNHDHHHNIEICLQQFSKKKIPLLINKSYEVRRSKDLLTFFGIDDYLTGLPVLPKAFSKAKSFTVLLCHNPDYISEYLYKHNRLPADLSLCGHTHGGQIRVPIARYPIYRNISDRRFIYGLSKIGKRHNFTSKGLGVVEIPYRIACKPEACILELRRKE